MKFLFTFLLAASALAAPLTTNQEVMPASQQAGVRRVNSMGTTPFRIDISIMQGGVDVAVCGDTGAPCTSDGECCNPFHCHVVGTGEQICT